MNWMARHPWLTAFLGAGIGFTVGALCLWRWGPHLFGALALTAGGVYQYRRRGPSVPEVLAEQELSKQHAADVQIEHAAAEAGTSARVDWDSTSSAPSPRHKKEPQ